MSQQDRNIRKLLAAKELRMAEELRETRSRFTRWLKIGVPAFAALLIITAIVRKPPERASLQSGGPETSASMTDDEKVLAKLDQMRPDSPSAASAGGPSIKKDDVHFAMELLNFLEPETAPPKEH